MAQVSLRPQGEAGYVVRLRSIACESAHSLKNRLVRFLGVPPRHLKEEVAQAGYSKLLTVTIHGLRHAVGV